MKIQKESDLLDESKRKKLIEELNDSWNQKRKQEAFRRYDCLKGGTFFYVLEMLLLQFDTVTVAEMQYSVANVAIVKKIIDKLARVYANGVKRTLGPNDDTPAMEDMAKLLKLDHLMKRANHYLKLQKNILLYPRPVKTFEYGEPKYELKVSALQPFLYDVVEDPDDPERALAVILSDFKPNRALLYAIDAASALRSGAQVIKQLQTQPLNQSSGMAQSGPPDALGATEESDKPGMAKQTYVWWTKNYHFTTNEKGQIMPNVATDGFDLSGTANPLGELPFVDMAEERDGHYWARGGKDLVDSGVQVNSLLTHINHIAVTQGYGQLYMTGKNLPKSIKTGPNHCLQFQQDEGEPNPQIGYLTANPPIAELIRLVEAAVGLTLSTNNLSASGVSTTTKSSGADFASGVAMMIDKSESVEDIEDQCLMFRDAEPKLWDLLAKWQVMYKSRGLLTDDFAALTLPDDFKDLSLAFPPPKTVLSEMEQLQVIQMREQLGLSTKLELLMRDDPSLTEETAQEKLDKITEEKKANMAEFGMQEGGADNGDGNSNGNGSGGGGGFSKQNDVNDQPKPPGGPGPGRKGKRKGKGSSVSQGASAAEPS